MATSFQFLDVGQGDGTFIFCDNGNTILIDLGSKKNADVAGSSAVTYVHDKLIEIQEEHGFDNPTINLLIITHPDGDHYNLLPELIDSFDDDDDDLVIREIAIGGTKNNYSLELRNALLDEADTNNTLVTFEDQEHDPNDKPRWTFDDAKLEIYLLCVNGYTFAPNPKSIVTQIRYAGRRIMLMGDAESDIENLILGWYDAAFLQSDGLKLGHHGSKNGTSNAWLNAVLPCMIFASSDMKWAHPYCETIKRVTENINLWALMDHLWLCGSGANASKEYYNHTNDCGVYTTLAWQVQLDEDVQTDMELDVNMEIEKEYDPNNVLPDGMVLGTQYDLTIFAKTVGQLKGDMQLACEVNDMILDSGRFNNNTKPWANCPNPFPADSLAFGPVVLDGIGPLNGRTAEPALVSGSAH